MLGGVVYFAQSAEKKYLVPGRPAPFRPSTTLIIITFDTSSSYCEIMDSMQTSVALPNYR